MIMPIEPCPPHPPPLLFTTPLTTIYHDIAHHSLTHHHQLRRRQQLPNLHDIELHSLCNTLPEVMTHGTVQQEIPLEVFPFMLGGEEVFDGEVDRGLVSDVVFFISHTFTLIRIVDTLWGGGGVV